MWCESQSHAPGKLKNLHPLPPTEESGLEVRLILCNDAKPNRPFSPPAAAPHTPIQPPTSPTRLADVHLPPPSLPSLPNNNTRSSALPRGGGSCDPRRQAC